MAIEKTIDVNVNLGDATKQLEFLNGELETAKDITAEWEKELFDLEKQLKAVPKNNLAQQKKLRDEITKQKDLIKEQKFAVKDLTKARGKANEVVKNATKNQADYTGATGLADRATGGLFGSVKNLTTSLTSATKGFNFLKIAIIGSGIGALALGILAVVQAFKRSEEGQNKFAKIMAVIGAVTDQFLDVLANVGDKIISVFSDPKQAIIDLKDLIIENITNRITSLIDTFGFLGSAIKKVFSGDFTGALEDAKSAGSSYIDTMTGVKDTIGKTTEAVKEFAKETLKEANQAGAIADRRAKADKLERQLLVDRAKANRDIAKLREQAEDREKFSAEERIKFIQEASKIDDDITAKEIAKVRLRVQAKKEENALGLSTKEDKMEQAQLEAELIALETQRFSKKRALTARTQALVREAQAEENRIAQEKINLQKQIIEAEANTLDEKRKLELQKEQEKYDALIEQAEANNLNTDELEISRNERLAEMRQAFADQDDAIKAKSVEEQKKLDKKKLDDQIATIQAEESNRQAQISQVGGAINSLQSIFSAFGEENKALAIAGIVTEQVSAISKIISNTAVANAKSVAATPLTGGMPFVAINNITAGLSIAGSVAGAVKAIGDLKSKKKSPSSGTAPRGAGGGGGSAPAEAPPSFNIVGASGTDQLAEAIGGQTQAPVQAYVVSNDVSTAQSMDRNIVENASI
jgi:myosin heavy subunit